MNILHVVPTFWPAIRYGGPIRSTLGLARAQADLGHKVEVITTDVDGPGRVDRPANKPIEMDGFTIRYCTTDLGRLGRRLYKSSAMASALRQSVPHADIVHIHACFLWPGYQASRCALDLGKPYILSPRGMLAGELIEQRSAWIKRAWIALIERRTLTGATAIHVTSQREAQDIRDLGLDLAPFVTLPNGVEPPPDHNPKSTDDPAWEGAPAGSRILFLGRINWKKGIDLLLAAGQYLPEAFLVIAGNDEEGLTPQLQAMAIELGMADRVHFRGEVEGPAKWSLIGQADVMAVPSLNENFGIVVAEALAAGLPVVCTEGVGAAELLADLAPDCIVPHDARALGHKLAELLADAPRRQQIGEAGRALMAERYSWTSIARRMVELYPTATAA